MITTIITEHNIFPEVVKVECTLLPGPRVIQVGRVLKFQYNDFIPKLLFLLKRFGYKKYLQKIYLDFPEVEYTLRSREYELPIFLAVMQKIGLLPQNLNFLCNGSINLDELLTISSYDLTKIAPLLTEKPVFALTPVYGTALTNIITSPEKLLKPIIPSKNLSISDTNKYLVIGNLPEFFNQNDNSRLLLAKEFLPDLLDIYKSEPFINLSTMNVSKIFALDNKVLTVFPLVIDITRSTLKKIPAIIDLLKNKPVQLYIRTQGCLCGNRFTKKDCTCSYQDKENYKSLVELLLNDSDIKCINNTSLTHKALSATDAARILTL
jgi:hypothetical protein